MTNMRKHWVLVVDDEANNRDLLSRRLQRAGFEVVQAESGIEALDLIGKTWVDLVLLDQMMPGMNGIQMLEKLRRTHSAAELPVIMVTAHSEPAHIVAALSAGANDFVAKPIEFSVLQARMEVQLRRKAAEDELRSSRNRNRAVLECALDGIAIVDHQGVVQEMNPAAEAAFGIPPGFGAGQNLAALLGESGPQQGLESLLFGTQESPLGRLAETVARRLDGSQFPAEICVIRIPETEPWLFALFMRDITRRKQAEDVVRQNHEDLENRVRQRTTDLSQANDTLRTEISERQRAQADLAKARDSALANARTTSDFLEKMTGEVGSLLFSILGLGGIGSESLGPGQKEDLEAALQSAAALQLMLSDMKTVAQHSNVPPGEVDDVNLHDTLERIHRQLERQASDKHLALEMELGAGLPRWIKADAWQLRQIVTALLLKAIEVSERGQVVLRADLAAVDGDSAHLHLQIRYGGVCKPEAEQRSALDSSSTGSGSGLSASMAKRLVEAAGGSLWLEHASTAGGLFQLHLTVQFAAAAVEA